MLKTISPAKILQDTKLYTRLLQLRKFFRKAIASPGHILLAVFFSLAAAIFDGSSFGILIPAIQGLLQRDFDFIEGVPVLGDLVYWFPPIFTEPNFNVFAALISLIFIAAVLKNFCGYFSSLVLSFQIRQSASNLRILIYQRYLSFGKLFFDQNSIGHLHQILMGYTNQVINQLRGLKGALQSIFSLLAYLAIMMMISWQLTLLVLTIFPILHYSLKWLIRKIAATSRDFARSYSALGKNISNALSCMPLIKAYTNEENEKNRFRDASDLVAKFQFSIDKKQLLIPPFQEIVSLSMMVLLVALMAFFVVHEGAGKVPGFMVFFVLLRRTVGLLGVFNHIQTTLATIEGPIAEILNVFDDNEKYFVPDGPLQFPGLEKAIEFNHLNFCYPNGTHVLKDVCFTVDKGKMTALVGPSGSGKTTLIHLLMRFYDVPPGTIRVDGVDIRDFSTKSLRCQIALVTQETQLFNAPLRDNLVYGLARKIGDEELLAAAQKARLRALIEQLPHGIATEIGERGVKLSGGEKQRVSIARAILKGAEILIFDEATSALDSRTEKFIQNAIDEAIEGRTAVVIAHRLSTIKRADKIVVVEYGRVVEEGALPELLEKKGKFYEYWQEQKFF